MLAIVFCHTWSLCSDRVIVTQFSNNPYDTSFLYQSIYSLRGELERLKNQKTTFLNDLKKTKGELGLVNNELKKTKGQLGLANNELGRVYKALNALRNVHAKTINQSEILKKENAVLQSKELELRQLKKSCEELLTEIQILLSYLQDFDFATLKNQK